MRISTRAIFAALITMLLAPALLRADESDTRISFSVNPTTVAFGQSVKVGITVTGCDQYVTLHVGPQSFALGLSGSGERGGGTFTVSGLPPGANKVYATVVRSSSCSPYYGSPGPTITVIPPVSGYINPKYIVLGVYYVVPGPQSTAQYCTNTSVGTTNSITSTFTSSYQNSVSIGSGLTIKGWFQGSQTSTTTTTYTEASSVGNSISITQSTSLCNQIPGPANAYQPNNHDYDIILVWTNPVLLLSYDEDANGNIVTIQWNGYGFNQKDQPAMEVDQIYAGCLKGDLPTGAGTPCASNLAPLQRTWDTDTTWASGGPALNAQDLANVLAADPFGTCTPSAKISPSSYPADNCTISPQPDRFTITDTQDVTYQQPIPGAGPSNTKYTLGYTVANTQSQGYSVTNSTTFGVETSYQVGEFLTDTYKVTSSQTYSTKTDTNQSLTTTNGTTMTLSVTGPPCVVSGSSCNPSYPSTAAPGPTQFDVYEDTLYGTFLVVPANWYY